MSVQEPWTSKMVQYKKKISVVWQWKAICNMTFWEHKWQKLSEKRESLRCWLMRRMQISIKGHWNPSPVQKLSVTAIWFLLIIYHRSVKNCHNSFHLSSKISWNNGGHKYTHIYIVTLSRFSIKPVSKKTFFLIPHMVVLEKGLKIGFWQIHIKKIATGL